MKRKSLINIASLGLGLPFLFANCSTTLPKLEAPRMEQRLLAAGFITVPADTVEKATKLQTLPPYRLVKRKTKDAIGRAMPKMPPMPMGMKKGGKAMKKGK